jgi:hypothetical protein
MIAQQLRDLGWLDDDPELLAWLKTRYLAWFGYYYIDGERHDV